MKIWSSKDNTMMIYIGVNIDDCLLVFYDVNICK